MNQPTIKQLMEEARRIQARAVAQMHDRTRIALFDQGAVYRGNDLLEVRAADGRTFLVKIIPTQETFDSCVLEARQNLG